MKRFETLRYESSDDGPMYFIWDGETGEPADGIYFAAEIADAVTDGANRLLAAGGDPYRDWGWNDGRGRAIAGEITGLIPNERQTDEAVALLVRQGQLEVRVNPASGEPEYRASARQATAEGGTP